MCEHDENCRYHGKDLRLLYACMEISEKKFITVSASEIGVYDEYLEASLKNDVEVIINLDEPDKEPFQIVYGGIFINKLYENKKKFALEFVDKYKNYALGELDSDKKVNISVYNDIQLFPELAYAPEGDYIPFAALMKTKHELKDMKYSVTMFPLNATMTVFESMLNRPFLLACRESRRIDGLMEENWKDNLDLELLKKAYVKADLYTGVGEESEE